MTTSSSDVRDDLARIVKARPTDRILFTSDIAGAIALVCDGAPGEVVELDLSAGLSPHPRRGDRRVVPAQIDLRTTLAAVESELQRRPAALLIVPAVGERTGEVLPLSALASIAHRGGARLLVDGSELVSRRALNLTSHGIDYLVVSGPSVGRPAVLIGRTDWIAHCEPGTAGELGFAHPAAGLGFEWSGAHEQALSDWLDTEVARTPGLRRLQLWPDATDRVGITSLAVAGRTEPVVLRWDAATGIDELARHLNSITDNVLEQEKS